MCSSRTYLIRTEFLGLIVAIHVSFAQQPAKLAAGSDANEESLRQTAARTLSSLGVAYFEKQQFAKAITTFEDALKYDPANKDMWTNLGMVPGRSPVLARGELQAVEVSGRRRASTY